MKKMNFLLATIVSLLVFSPVLAKRKVDPNKNGRGGYEYFVGIVGNPSVVSDIKWDDQQLIDLKELGVNMLQLSIAWGGKPGDEVINLEDFEDEEQVSKWKYRIQQCEKYGFKTLAHFVIPRMLNYDPVKPACIQDQEIRTNYVNLMNKFMTTFPEVNDILVYTYDPKAWLRVNFKPLTWRSDAEPDWSKWIAP